MLDLSDMNYLAVFVAWLVNVVVGWFWYSPTGFGKTWSRLSGVDLMKIPQEEATKTIGFVALSAVVQAGVLAIVINSLFVNTLENGFLVGFTLWLGFTAATTVGTSLYSRKGWKFWWLNSSYFLVVMVINSVILSLWR
jgi:hypothetical protein